MRGNFIDDLSWASSARGNFLEFGTASNEPRELRRGIPARVVIFAERDIRSVQKTLRNARPVASLVGVRLDSLSRFSRSGLSSRKRPTEALIYGLNMFFGWHPNFWWSVAVTLARGFSARSAETPVDFCPCEISTPEKTHRYHPDRKHRNGARSKVDRCQATRPENRFRL